ncbi:response regulator [bacterium]|nr:response regulator [bacterium]MBU1883049.1 response regulator [bacterium]
MNNLRLLIVDDEEDNRIVLKAICKKLNGFEIRDVIDGIEALEVVESWHPHIVLMDIMMPNLDGFEASKIIKAKYPDTVIIVVTAAYNPSMQDNLSAIGVDIYIHKPIDRELIRYKLESVGSSLRAKSGNFKNLSKKNALNPFNSDIRSFKTFFEITDTEAMMDFGMWLFDQYNGKSATSCKFDKVIEIFYKLMNVGYKKGETTNIIIEESYEEFYITIKFDSEIKLEDNLLNMLQEFGTGFVAQKNIVCVSLSKPCDIKVEKTETPVEKEKIPNKTIKAKETKKVTKEVTKEVKQDVVKQVKVVHSKEKELLKQTFVNKTSAVDYVEDIGGDVLEEIRDLASLDEEWMMKLRMIEEEPTQTSLIDFADSVLGTYVKVINNLFEFTALAYALSSLGVFIKESAVMVSQDSAKLKMFIMLLEHLGTDLTSWREHVFIFQDTADIHYLDSSFFSSCMQIEGIIDNKHINAHDDENDMEFF